MVGGWIHISDFQISESGFTTAENRQMYRLLSILIFSNILLPAFLLAK
jgi:hypothetical protein